MAKKEKEKGVVRLSLENYWYYYKWPTIGGIVVFFIVLIALVNFSTPQEESADVTVMSVFARPLTTQDYEFQSRLENTISDVDQNNTKKITMNSIYISDSGNTDNDALEKSKFDNAIAYATGDLVLLDKTNLDRYYPKDFLAPLTDYNIDLTAVAPEDIVYRNDVPVAVRLSDSKVLLEMGFIIDDVYAAIMFVPENKTEQTDAKRQNAANMICELLVKADITELPAETAEEEQENEAQ